LDNILDHCKYENIGNRPNAFTDAYFADTEDIPNLYKEFDINLIEAFSCEGIAAFMNEKINQLVDGPETFKKLISLIIRTCTVPSCLGSGEHCVFIGQK